MALQKVPNNMVDPIGNAALAFDGGAFGFRNAVINGNCRVGQRGAVSVVNNSGLYGGADRILGYPNSFATCTGTLQQSSGNATTSGYAQQMTLTTTGTGSVIFATRIEARDCARFAGKTVTISARLYQDTGSTVTTGIQLYKANAVDNFSGSTQIGTTISSGSVPTSNWTTISAQFSLSAADVANGLMIFWQNQSIGAVTSKTFAIGDLQMTEGVGITPMECAPYQTDLAACQRYYWQSISTGGLFLPRSTAGQAYTTSGFEGAMFSFPVTMRASPSYSGSNIGFYNPRIGRIAAGSVSAYQSYPDSSIMQNTGSSGFVAGEMFWMVATTTNGYAAFSAEL